MTRSLVRTRLAQLITDKLPDATVLRYRKADPKGVSPLIEVCSGGTDYPRATMKGSFPQHEIRVYSLVLHSDPQSPEWTEEKAEDLLDSNALAISQVIDSNQKTDAWKRISYAGKSVAERVEIGGIPYLLEVMLFEVEELQ